MPTQVSKKQKIEAALRGLRLRVDAMAPAVAASLIVEAVVPFAENNPGGTFYRLKAEQWLSLLLASEPEMAVEQLAVRVAALAAVSEPIAGELGGLAARLHMLLS